MRRWPGSAPRDPTVPWQPIVGSSPAASGGAGRSTSPSRARDAACAAAPWFAAMQSIPGIRMVWAESEGGAYPAALGEGAIGLIAGAREAIPAQLPARSFCVADAAVLERHARLLPRCEATIEVEGAESSKTISEAERVLRELAAAGARRDDC